MSDAASNNKRIVKNTIFLYLRTIIIMLVSLYTTRAVLDALGVEDYGIYNLLGDIVVLFTFINNAMITSTQRYLNFELGKNDYLSARKVFSISINIYILIALFVFLLSETIGLWLINTTLQYPESRKFAVHVIYQLSILTTCVKIIRSPYSAVIVAYERMSFFAYFSLLEASMQLGIVYMLILFDTDRLITYGVLLCIVAIIINLCYYFYCRKSFDICSYKYYRDKALYSQLLSFSGWSLFGGVANIGASKGLNMLMNVFFGITVNAAMGVANQVNSAVSSFLGSFQTAFNPQLVKSYAAGNMDYFVKLIFATSKFSYLLLFAITLPIYICCPEILNIWLVDVPDYSVAFCRLMLIFSLLDAFQAPLWLSVQATGKIKIYQILMSIMIFMNLPIAYLFLKMGCSPDSVLVVRCIINFVTLFVRLWYLHRLYEFPVCMYMKDVLFRIVLITLIANMVAYIPMSNIQQPILKVIIVLAETIIVNMALVMTIGLNRVERQVVTRNIKRLYEKYKRI